MSEIQIQEIADAASVIANVYAMSRDGSNIRIVNLNSGHVAICSETEKILETSMDDIEMSIALDRFRANRQFMGE